MSVFVRHEFNYDMSLASKESGLDCSDSESMTKQSFAEECDINTIVKRFGLTGEMPVGHEMPQFGDYIGVKDFKSAMDVVAEARENFEAMPAHVRARFQNDPQLFLEFCEDGSNFEEAKKLGLVQATVLAAQIAGVPSAAAAAGAVAAAPVAPKPTS